MHALITAAQQGESAVGKIFVIGCFALILGGIGIWTLRLAFAPNTSFKGRLMELALSALSFGGLYLAVVAVLGGK